MFKLNKHLYDQILFNQYGAIKPPWISKEVFYKLPFNYCDRWCEKCNLRKICRVNIIELQRRDKFIKKGIDPDSMNATFIILNETFENLKTRLENDLKRFNISKKDLENIENSEQLIEVKIKSDYLLKISLSITKKLNSLYEDIFHNFMMLYEDEIKIRSELENSVYYMFFFTPKIYRALSSNFEKDDDYIDNDDKTSAFFANIAIKKIIIELEKLSKLKKLPIELRIKTKKLILVLDDLFDLINKRFVI